MVKLLILFVVIAAFTAWRSYKSYRRIKRGRRHDDAMHSLYLKSRGRRRFGAIFFGDRPQLRIEHLPLADGDKATRPASEL